MMGNRFEVDSKAFIDWFASSEADLSAKVTLADYREQGQNRCLIAKELIKKDEVLFTLPRPMLLNVVTSALADVSEDVKNDLLTEVGHWEGLVMCLYFELRILGEKSKWWPYLNILPTSDKLDNLMYWSEEEIEKLKPSLVLSRVGKNAAKDMHERILAFAKRWQVEELIRLKWDDFVHVASIIMAYSFDCEQPNHAAESDDEVSDLEIAGTVNADGYLKCMVPLADILNSDTNLVNANLIYDDEILKMVAVRDIEEGDQIYNIYGEFSNAEILRRYGYVEANGSKYDYAEVELAGILRIASAELDVAIKVFDDIIEILSGEEDWIDELFEGEQPILQAYDCFTDGEIMPQCVFFVQLLTTLGQMPKLSSLQPDDLKVQVRKVSKKVLQLLEAGKVTKKAVAIWETIVNDRLSQYPQQALQNKTPVNLGDLRNPAERRQYMAECVLKSEIQALQNCLHSMNKSYDVIDDSKLMNNILKRKSEFTDKKSAKRQTLQRSG